MEIRHGLNTAFIAAVLFVSANLVAETVERLIQADRPFIRHGQSTFAERLHALRQRLKGLPPEQKRQFSADWKPVLKTFRNQRHPSADEVNAAFVQVRRNLTRRAVAASGQPEGPSAERRRSTLAQLQLLNALKSEHDDEQLTVTRRMPDLVGSRPADDEPNSMASIRAERFRWRQAEAEHLHGLGPMNAEQRLQARQAFRDANAEQLNDLRSRFHHASQQQQHHEQKARHTEPEPRDTEPASPVAKLIRQRSQERIQLMRDLASAPEADRREALQLFDDATRSAIRTFTTNRP